MGLDLSVVDSKFDSCISCFSVKYVVLRNKNTN